MLGIVMLVLWAATIAFAAGVLLGMKIGAEGEINRRRREGR